MESEAETELEEEGKTHSQKTNGLAIFGVSQDPLDKEKVLRIVKKKIKNVFPLMMDPDQSNTESVEEIKLVEVEKIDSQNANVSDNSQNMNKAHLS